MITEPVDQLHASYPFQEPVIDWHAVLTYVAPHPAGDHEGGSCELAAARVSGSAVSSVYKPCPTVAEPSIGDLCELMVIGEAPD